MLFRSINWISAVPKNETKLSVRIRYRQTLHECVFVQDGDKVTLELEIPQTVDAGQSAVLYDGDLCIGGGVVE